MLWFYSQIEDSESALHIESNISDLLERVHKSFHGMPEKWKLWKVNSGYII